MLTGSILGFHKRMFIQAQYNSYYFTYLKHGLLFKFAKFQSTLLRICESEYALP